MWCHAVHAVHAGPNSGLVGSGGGMRGVMGESMSEGTYVTGHSKWRLFRYITCEEWRSKMSETGPTPLQHRHSMLSLLLALLPAAYAAQRGGKGFRDRPDLVVDYPELHDLDFSTNFASLHDTSNTTASNVTYRYKTNKTEREL